MLAPSAKTAAHAGMCKAPACPNSPARLANPPGHPNMHDLHRFGDPTTMAALPRPLCRCCWCHVNRWCYGNSCFHDSPSLIANTTQGFQTERHQALLSKRTPQTGKTRRLRATLVARSRGHSPVPRWCQSFGEAHSVRKRRSGGAASVRQPKVSQSPSKLADKVRLISPRHWLPAMVGRSGFGGFAWSYWRAPSTRSAQLGSCAW